MVKPSFNEEQLLWKQGILHVIGLDEVGRGAFAGPLVAAGVVFDQNFLTKDTPCTRSILTHVTDSKLLKPNVRESLTEIIKQSATYYAIAEISVSFINKHGIGYANCAAFRKVVRDIATQLNQKTQEKIQPYFLLDGRSIKYMPFGGLKNQKAIIKGDQKCISIAAASIIAKVYRDQLMRTLDKKFPQYFFSIHKGYGTKKHQEALKTHGACKLHRNAFIKNLSF